MYDFDNPSNQELLQQASELSDVGKRREARSIIKQAIRNDSRDVEAWWALTYLATSDAERNHALKQVLNLDPNNPHALQMRDQIRAGSIQPIDSGFSSSSNRKPYQEKPDYGFMQSKDFLPSAIITLVAYMVIWFVGLGFNIYYLRETKKLEEATGREQPNKGCLQALMWVYVYLPLIAVGFIFLTAMLRL
jgi:hypothetical protein